MFEDSDIHGLYEPALSQMFQSRKGPLEDFSKTASYGVPSDLAAAYQLIPKAMCSGLDDTMDGIRPSTAWARPYDNPTMQWLCQNAQ